jgi:hypothetical protein
VTETKQKRAYVSGPHVVRRQGGVYYAYVPGLGRSGMQTLRTTDKVQAELRLKAMLTDCETLTGTVYFIQSESGGPIKIGWTGALSPQRRLNDMQTGRADNLVALGILPGTRETESFLHRRFAADHVRGEWFNPSEDLLWFIRMLAPKLSTVSKAGVVSSHFGTKAGKKGRSDG